MSQSQVLNRHPAAGAVGLTATGIRLGFLLSVVPPAVLMAIIWLQPYIDPALLLRDPLAVAELRGADCCKVYYGAVSNLGILIWISGAAVSLFGAVLLLTIRRRGNLPNDDAELSFLLVGGLLTAVLSFDDMFLVHENVLDFFGIPQIVTYGAYASLALAYLWTSWAVIKRSGLRWFLCAGGFLALSVLIDIAPFEGERLRIVVEDGAKLIGICAWTGFHLLATWSILSGLAAPLRDQGR